MLYGYNFELLMIYFHYIHIYPKFKLTCLLWRNILIPLLNLGSTTVLPGFYALFRIIPPHIFIPLLLGVFGDQSSFPKYRTAVVPTLREPGKSKKFKFVRISFLQFLILRITSHKY